MEQICAICNKNDEKNMYRCPKCEIYYCSLKCYSQPIHSACEYNFKYGELNKIIKVSKDSTSFDEYDRILNNMKLKNVTLGETWNDNCIVNQTVTSSSLSNVDYGMMDRYYRKLSKNMKQKFLEYVRNVLKLNEDTENCTLALLVSQPWWVIIFQIRNGKLIEEVNSTVESINEKILNDILPHLFPKINLLSLENMNKNASTKFSDKVGLIVHRLMLVYISCIRIYGNRIQSLVNRNDKIYMDKILANCILSLVTPIHCNNSEKFSKFYSSFEQLFENYEVDILNFFKEDWNYSSFNMSEQFFIDIYNDYIMILNENYCEDNIANRNGSNNLSSYVSFLFLALSDIYYIFKKRDSNKKNVFILKKILFYIAWCKQYYCSDNFRVVLNFLQFRCDYHKKIVKNHQSLPPDELALLKSSMIKDSSHATLLDKLFSDVKNIKL